MRAHDEIQSRLEALERTVRYQRRVGAVLLTALALIGATAFQSTDRRMRLSELDVERINIVGPDGGLALVLASRGRLPGVIVAGREAPPELSAGRRGAAGLLFFNKRGDEVGGLTYLGEDTANGHRAHGHLSFDQYRQQDVVTLQYADDGQHRRAGLHVWDRPTDVTLEDVISAATARSKGGRAAPALATGAPRVFLGSDDGVAALRLMDNAGRPRIRIAVEPNGRPRLEFLDANGTVTHSVPSDDRDAKR